MEAEYSKQKHQVVSPKSEQSILNTRFQIQEIVGVHVAWDAPTTWNAPLVTYKYSIEMCRVFISVPAQLQNQKTSFVLLQNIAN